MPKHALIVDDSRSARVALQKLLEKHGVDVSFAASGEEAIEFLQHHEVDAIFMDHTMPGMSGFEAVSAIKGDPRTAMIPVMMYTAKEGEVYLGQARALGAIGVLPKELQPGVVFEMLLKLGLAKERRAGRRRIADPSAAAPATPAETTDQMLDRQALGVSIQALVTRILQDQHLELRSDILASNRDFARRVAEEIHARQAAEAREQAIEVPPPSPPSGSGRGAALFLVGLLPAAVLFLMWSQAANERDTAQAEQARLAAAMEQQSGLVVSLQDALMGGFEVEAPVRGGGHSRALVEALEWAANQGNNFGYLEQPFDDVRLERLRDLVTRLAAVGFTGTIRMDAHAGEFCLASDGAGGYQLAEPDMSILDCVLLSDPPRAGASGEQQSIAFANFLASSPLLNDNGIEVRAQAHGSRASTRRHSFSPGIRTAGEWNRIAELNNRVEFTLIPAD
jgi:CheY-like chemotaxis protein